MKSGIFRVVHFSLVFANYIFLLQVQRVSTSKQFLTLSPGEPNEIILSNNNPEMKINITYLGLETVYDISDSYSFFIPNVSIECECKCMNKHEQYCSGQSHKRNWDCGQLQNSTTTCTVYETEGKDSNVCPAYFKLCCQTYFSKSKVLESYTAFHLKFSRSIYKIRMNSIVEDRKDINVNVYNGANSLLLYPKIIMDVYNSFPVNLMKEDWYYMVKSSKELLHSPAINAVDETNLNKLGWFQIKKGETSFQRISWRNLETQLRVKPINCQSNPPTYAWNLEAKEYSRNNLIYLTEDGQKILELFKTNIHGYSLYLMEKKIVFQSKISHKLNISISNIDEINQKSFMYNCSIIVDKEWKHKLHFIFFKGHGLFRMEVVNSFLSDTYKFSLKVFNASKENPFSFTKTLPFNDYNSTLICVYWGKDQLCQLPQMIEYEQTQKEGTAESTPFITEANTEFLYTQKDDQTIVTADKNKNQPYYKNLFIILSALCILEHTIFIAYYFRKKWKKRRNDSGIVLRGVFTEETKVPLLIHDSKQTSFSTEGLEKFGKENVEFGNPCEEIVKELRPDVWKHFGKQIGFSDSELDSMVAESDENKWSFQERCHMMLKKFRNKFPNKFNVEFFKSNLKECQLWYELEKDPVALIREKLENYYRSMKAPHFSWMGDIQLNYDEFNFQLQHLQDQGSQFISQNPNFPPLSRRNSCMLQGNFKRTVPLHQIFEGNSDETSQKILIEGQKRTGKTSLCLKLAYDWMNSKTYMDQFNFVFIINLGKLESNIENYLTKVIFNNESIHLVQVLLSVKKKILFILDGYHELKAEHKKNVLKLLSGRLFRNSSVLLTCDTKDYFIDKDSDSTPNVKYFQTIFTFMEPSSEYQEHILCHRVFHADKFEKIALKDFLITLTPCEQKNVLLLLLIGIVQKNEGLRSVLSNRTKLFSKLCNFIANSATKDDRRDSINDMTMNNSNKYRENMVVDSLMEIGKMCLNLLEEGRISFTEDIKMSVADQTVVKEFVCLNNPMCFNSEDKLYTFIDQVFVDYLAAYYLWCVRNTEEFDERIRSLRMSKLLDYKSQLFKFLSALLGKHEYHLLLNALKPFAFYYSFDFNGYLNTMKESLVVEISTDLFQHFLPVSLEIVDTFDNLPPFYDFIFSNCSINSSVNKIKIIEWDAAKIFSISSKIKIEKLVLNVNSCISDKTLEICRLIQCEELVCVLKYVSGMSVESQWNCLMEMMENLKYEWISFHIINTQMKIYSLILEEMKTQKLKDKKIRNMFMHCGLSDINACLSLIEIIQTKEIESVFVRIFNDLVNVPLFSPQYIPENSQTVFDALVKSLSNNNGIKEFIFHNVSDMCFTVSVDDLTNRGSKHLDLVWLLGNLSVESDNEINDGEIKAFIVDSNKIDGQIMKTILGKSKSLIIGSHLNVFHFLDNATTALDPLQVKELDIYVTDDILQKNTFLYLKEFKNLKIFCLNMNIISNIPFDGDDDIVTVIQYLPCLETFEMINIECNFLLVSIITQKLMTFLSSHSSSDKTSALKFFRLAININVMKKDKINALLMEFCSVMQQTVEPLKQHRLQEFSLLFYDPNKERSDFILSLADVFPLRKGFRIRWDLDGKKDGSTRIKCYYKYLFLYHRFSVSFSPESE